MESTGWGPRVTCDGKQFSLEGRRFLFRGVTYGTFEPRIAEARYPDRSQIKSDVAAMAEAGFTVVRTYTPAPDDLLEEAWDCGLHVWPTAFWLDWRYLIGSSRRQQRSMLRDARQVVR